MYTELYIVLGMGALVLVALLLILFALDGERAAQNDRMRCKAGLEQYCKKR